MDNNLISNQKYIGRKDILIMLIITLVYGIIALVNLGDTKSIETFYSQQDGGSKIVVDFGKQANTEKMRWFQGSYHEIEATIETSADGQDWNKVSGFVDEKGNELEKMNFSKVFKWDAVSADMSGRYIRIEFLKDEYMLGEIAFYDANGEMLTPVSVTDANGKDLMPLLFDEQDLVVTKSTYLNSTYFDEIYHARTGYEFIHSMDVYENTHPPLGKIFISIGIAIFGMNPFGYRIIGVIFGILMLPAMYLFAKRMFKRIDIAAIVTIIFAFDFMHFTQTRISTIDTYIVFFIMISYYFMYMYVSEPMGNRKNRVVYLLACGTMFGMAVASKWSGLYAGAGLAVLYFIDLYKYAKYENKNKNSAVIKLLLLTFVFFIIIPLIIYCLSYIPFLMGTRQGIEGIWKNQISMFNYHSQLDATHPYSSQWWSWPVIVRPIWYYSNTFDNGFKAGISAFGNPAVWWGGIIALIATINIGIKKKDYKALFLVIGYASQYVPNMLIGRVMFIYHYFPSIIFVVLMIGYVFNNIDKKYNKIMYIYCALVLILFAMFYPVLMGLPINPAYTDMFLRWFPSWVLM